MSVHFKATVAASFLAVIVAMPVHAQSSSVKILEAFTDGGTPPSPAAPLAVSDNDFPLASLTEVQEGTVVLNLLVDTQGRVTFSQRLTSSGFDGLDQAAQQVARTRWTFQPASKDGQAVVQSVKVEVNWKLPLLPADEFTAEIIGIPAAGKSVTQPKPKLDANRTRGANYPTASVRRGEQGEVALRVEILETGNVGQVVVLDSSGFSRLDDSAIEAAKRWAYEPGTVDGQPTRMWTHVMWQFNLGPPVVGRKPAEPPQQSPRTYCHSRPILTTPVLVTAEATNDQVNLRQWAHAKADGIIDDVLILTTKGWMRFNDTLTENLSRAAQLRPAASVNRAESCWFNASLAVRPMVENSAEALLQRGMSNRRQDNLDSAIEDYTKAIAINPNLAQAYVDRATAYSAKGDDDSAIKDFEQALSISPDHLGARTGLAGAYRRTGQFEDAMKQYDLGIRHSPRNGMLYNNRCYSLVVAGKAREALADCNRSLSLAPRYPMALDSRGYAYLKMGDYRAAIADFDAALKGRSDMSSSFYGRGIAKIRAGNADDGNADIAQAIKLDAQIAEKMAKDGFVP